MINKMRSILLLSALALIFCTSPACSGGSIIASVKASEKVLYPEGTSGIQCIVAVPDSSKLNYMWSCTDGIISGNGPAITWKAPNKYGDFSIMVVVEDASGKKDKATVTIGVIANPDQDAGCSTCPSR